jgi:hypothetical protein
MKKTILVLASMVSIGVQAQITYATDVLDVNNVHASISSFGNFFNGANFVVPHTEGISAIYKHSMWIGGLNPSGELHLAAEKYGQGGADFWHGPIADNYDTSFDDSYNKVWKVNKQTIETHILEFANNGYVVPTELSDWPAHGDVSNGEAENLAPFVDVNGNSIYDPENGDYPAIKGDQTLFIIFNDDREEHTESDGAKLGIEVHAMLYAYTCSDNSIASLNESVFLSLKIINRKTTSLTDMYVGSFTDFDIGAYYDDFAGCDTTLNMYYAYNSDNVDSLSYGINPPAIGVKLLNSDFHSCLTLSNSHLITGDPNTTSDFYNSLLGNWLDSTHLTFGAQGIEGYIPTNFMYSSSPSDSLGWSAFQVGTSGMDIRAVGSVGPYDFNPGNVISLDYAFIYARDESFDHIENADLLLQNAVGIQDLYDGTVTNDCLSGVGLEEYEVFSGTLYPNPSAHSITIDSEELGLLQMYNVLGELVFEQDKQTKQINIKVSDLEPGVYFIKLNNTATRFMKE